MAPLRLLHDDPSCRKQYHKHRQKEDEYRESSISQLITKPPTSPRSNPLLDQVRHGGITLARLLKGPGCSSLAAAALADPPRICPEAGQESIPGRSKSGSTCPQLRSCQDAQGLAPDLSASAGTTDKPVTFPSWTSMMIPLSGQWISNPLAASYTALASFNPPLHSACLTRVQS